MLDDGQTRPSEPAPPPLSPAKTGGGSTLWAFTLTTFLSALLLFSVQPMFAKMVLPVLGGSPSVWAVAMCFFQAALLAGYCYAHVLIRWMPVRAGGFLHLALCLCAFVVLPIGLPAWFGEPPAGEPYLWQLGLFAVAVGLPFMAVSANAPLLQAWFSATGNPHARDPYFLYAASNLGSLIALLGYPLVLEPAFGLKALSWYWTLGYAALVAAIAIVFMMLRAAPASARVSAAPVGAAAVSAGTRPSWAQRLGWIGLALVPSALLTAFTTHITTDVASAPLLWVLPLSLYLLTFVLVFRERMLVWLPLAVLVAGLGVAVLNMVSSSTGIEFNLMNAIGAGIIAALAFTAVYVSSHISPMRWLLGVHLVAVVLALLVMSQTRNEGWFVTAPVGVLVFFASAMVAHRTLYEARPAPTYLTEFYLWMSFGGALGGLTTALLAPKIFSEVFEYPLLLALSMACRPGALDLDRYGRKWFEELCVVWLIFAAGFLAIYWVPWLVERAVMPSTAATGFEEISHAAWWITGPILFAKRFYVWALGWGATPLVVALLTAVIVFNGQHAPRQLMAAMLMVTAITWLPSNVKRGDAQRSYFGVYRVMLSLDGQWNTLVHGTTLHGAQRVRDAEGNTVADIAPATYYYENSPMARTVVTTREVAAEQNRKPRVGVIGLGTGSLACHASDGESWRFFEIDPVVIDIAVKSDSFTFMQNCQPTPDIVIGDARLTMAREADKSFDLIIVDAFSSDAVPVHLMTAEAMKLYLSKLTPTGVVLLHISNRYLDLDAVLGATATMVPGIHGIIQSDDSADGSYAQSTSTVGVFANTEAALAKFRENGEVTELDATKVKPWTDDYSDIIGPFMSKYRKRFN
jgi:hypothetical protein